MEKSLYQLSKQELECFSQLLEVTKNFISQTDSYELESVMKFLDLRDQWIGELKALEADRQKIKENMKRESKDSLRYKISEIARSLVAIDAKILDILQVKKMETVKEMTKIADNQSRKKKKRLFRGKEHKIIDIYRE
ncbi:MAG: hypothetical protein KAX28_13470 [Candidatus Marinimicrobia bacterium]|nr:hypothetical protein [Candidatus Neomarinimicrobiota bacterium]